MNTQKDPIVSRILTAIANLNLPPIRYTTERQRRLNWAEKPDKTTAIFVNNSNNKKNAI